MSQDTQRDVERDRSVVYAFTATPKAIERFRTALSHAESALHAATEEREARDGTSDRVQAGHEDCEWLRWGLSRITYAEGQRS